MALDTDLLLEPAEPSPYDLSFATAGAFTELEASVSGSSSVGASMGAYRGVGSVVTGTSEAKANVGVIRQASGSSAGGSTVTAIPTFRTGLVPFPIIGFATVGGRRSEDWFLEGAIVGQAVVTPSLSRVASLRAPLIRARATVSVTARRQRGLAGQIVGTSGISYREQTLLGGLIVGQGQVSGATEHEVGLRSAIQGQGLVTSTLLITQLGGQVTAQALVSGALFREKTMRATSVGKSTFTVKSIAVSLRAQSRDSKATAAATLDLLRGLQADLVGQAVVVARMDRILPIIIGTTVEATGASNGTSTVTAHLGVGALMGEAQGASDVQALLGVIQQLSGQSDGLADVLAEGMIYRGLASLVGGLSEVRALLTVIKPSGPIPVSLVIEVLKARTLTQVHEVNPHFTAPEYTF